MVDPSVTPSIETLTPRTGTIRLHLCTATGRHMLVGPFGGLGGARRMAEELLAEPGAVLVARIEHKQRGSWRAAWTLRSAR